MTCHQCFSQVPAFVGVSACAEYFYNFQRLTGYEFIVCRFESVEVPVYQYGECGWHVGPEPFLYSWAFNQQPVDFRRFALAFGDTLLIEGDWCVPNALKRDECYVTAAAMFPLTATWDSYLASLDKKSRYEIRRVDASLPWLHTHMGLPCAADRVRLMDYYEARMMSHFEMDAADARLHRQSQDLFIDCAARIGSLVALTFYDGARAVGLNIAERIPGRVLDIFSVWEPDVLARGSLGKFAINRNVEHAIALGVPVYDLGPFEVGEGDEIVTNYGYKKTWRPKGHLFPESLNFATATDMFAAKWLAGQATDRLDTHGYLYPPYFNLTRQQMVGA